MRDSRAHRGGSPLFRQAAAALLCGAAATLGFSCPSPQPPADVPLYGYQVVAHYPHDPTAYTQGLLFHAGTLYESTGRRGQSSVRAVDLESGRVIEKQDLAWQYFGEGLALYDGRLYQLTWTAGTGFVYSLEGLERQATFRYTGEGWGLTFDGAHFILSDGSDTLRFYNPADFSLDRTVEVADEAGPVEDLNELEWVDGEVWANVWKLDRIARIDPGTGEVTGWIDLAGLLDTADAGAHAGVLNGIAYDPAAQRLFVTGKNWPRLFEIEIVPISKEQE